MGIKAEQWESALTELARVLKPGGWIELTEVDAELYRVGPNTRELNQQLIQVMQMLHIDPYAGRTLKSKLEKISCLTDIQTTFISCPGGQWAGKVRYQSHSVWMDVDDERFFFFRLAWPTGAPIMASLLSCTWSQDMSISQYAVQRIRRQNGVLLA